MRALGGLLSRYRRGLLIVGVWLLVIAGVQIYAWRSGLMLPELQDAVRLWPSAGEYRRTVP